MSNIKSYSSKLVSSSLFRYLMTGGSAALAEILSFIAIQYTSNDLPVAAAQAISFTIGLIIAFVGHKLWTFRDSKINTSRHSTKLQFASYSSLAIINLALTTLLITTLVNIGIIPIAAKLLLMASVVTWNFIILQKIIFRKN